MVNLAMNDTEFQNGLNRILTSVPALFRNFPPDDLRELLQVGHPERHEKYSRIIDEASQSIDTAYLIVSGRVSVSKQGVHLASFHEGDFLEEIFLFSKGSRIATITAQDDTLLLRFNRSEVIDYFKRKPERLFTVFVINILEIQQRRIAKLLDAVISCQKKLTDPRIPE